MRSNRCSILFLRLLLLLLLLLVAWSPPSRWRGRGWGATAVSVNWGTSSSSSHPLPPTVVVPGLLQANRVARVKLPDADPSVLAALAGSGIAVAIGVPNEMLRSLSSSKSAAVSWVHDNVTRYVSSTGGGSVRIDSDVYQSESNLPSKGHFRPDLNKTMIELLSFLDKHGSPFVVDINPFLTFQQKKNLSLDFVLFQTNSHPLSDGPNKYRNHFDMSIDTLVSALSKVGYAEMDIIVGKIGWPTDGAMNATPAVAQIFMQGLVDRLQSKAGTPLRPKRPPRETYIFSLLDEDQRSIKTGNYERHWGIFTFDGQAKYNVDLGQGSKALASAHDVDYLAQKWCVVNNNKDISNVSSSASEACSAADCSALSPGGSCSGIGWPGNVSYAFNSYFQLRDQSADSCDFGGLGLITTVDPSIDDCRYSIALRTSFSTSIRQRLVARWSMMVQGGTVFAFLLAFVWC
ncbi:hypothetical protein B296_00032149 [Ensete ventricosum]|uniref:X8 domain-containing protein n=1 Tax=Ensete ventricosum TaxID=4639 RepID=A0A426ZXW0_ENSVE|nr:hypothetical protein B296_00032149 [Ensete ventricosum]